MWIRRKNGTKFHWTDKQVRMRRTETTIVKFNCGREFAIKEEDFTVPPPPQNTDEMCDECRRSR